MDVETLVSECQRAITEVDARRCVHDVLDRALADASLCASLRGAAPGLTTLHNTAELTVLNVVWPPHIRLYAHDHRMWAAIGIYNGREDNAFYRRDGSHIVASGGKQLTDGDVLQLGADAVHAVHNPLGIYTGAIHVYGGDFFGVPRSQWDDDTGEEKPFDFDALRRTFADAQRAASAES